MRTTEQTIIDAGDLTNEVVSELVQAYYLTGFSIQFTWSGNPKGVIKLFSSNDEIKNPPYSFHLIPESTIPVDGPGSFLIDVTKNNFRTVKAVYFPTSGDGTLKAKFIGKGR
jgi:hypothetical protein